MVFGGDDARGGGDGAGDIGEVPFGLGGGGGGDGEEEQDPAAAAAARIQARISNITATTNAEGNIQYSNILCNSYEKIRP